MFWAPVAWAVTLLVAALVRRRPTPGPRPPGRRRRGAARSAWCVGAIVADDPWASLRRFADARRPARRSRPGALTIAAAVIATASPHLSRPFRHFGRWLIAGCSSLGALFLGATTADAAASPPSPSALLAAAVVHLVVGSPGGRPTTSRDPSWRCEGLGLDVDELAPAAMHARGRRSQFDGTDATGRSPSRSTAATPGTASCSPTSGGWRGTADTQRDGPAEPARARRARGLRHAARRARRRARPAPRHGGQRRAGDALVVVRPDGSRCGPGWTRPRRRRRSTTALSTACGPTSTACTTPASPTAASTSTASSSATTGRSASATCRRRPSPRSPADLLQDDAQVLALGIAAARRGARRRAGPARARRRRAARGAAVRPGGGDAGAGPRRARTAPTSSSTTSAAACARRSARPSSR